jgi:hypothetical protein
MELAMMIDKQEIRDPRISALKEKLISSMPSQGPADDEVLARKLGWGSEDYIYICDLLVSEGVLCRNDEGVSLLRIDPAEKPISDRYTEKELYAPIHETLRSFWIPENGIHDFVFNVTASQGRRSTGGKWTRPDIALATCNSYLYVRARPIELRTFEVKTYEGLDVTSVYEALSHRRAAHYAYVLAYVPEYQREALRSVLERLTSDARAHGVGVTTLADPRKYETWRVEVEARRANPDPLDIETFVAEQTDDQFKRKIAQWCREI